MRSGLRIAASVALSGGFLYYAARGVSWPEVWAALSTARLIYVVPMIVGTILPIYFRALRWGLFVRPIARVSMRSLFAATAIGFAANMLLPLRAGEIARPWVLSRREAVGFSSAIATVALERLFDMGMLLLLFGVATLTLPLPLEWKRYGWLFLVAFLTLLTGLFALWRYPRNVLEATGRVLRPLPQTLRLRIVDVVHGFGTGLASLGSGRVVATAALYSAAVWLSLGVSFGFGFSALGLDLPWLRGALTTTTFVAIAVAIPGGPGFVGMFQAGCVVALEVFGVEKSLAFSYSVLTHVVQFASTVALGLYFVWQEGLRWAELGALEARAEASAEAKASD